MMHHNLIQEVSNWSTELLSKQLRLIVEESNHVPGNVVGGFDCNCPLCQVYNIVNDEMNKRIQDAEGKQEEAHDYGDGPFDDWRGCNMSEPKKKIAWTRTNLNVAQRIEQVGLDYAVRHYMNSDDFADRKTAELWDAAEKAMNDLVNHLVQSGANFLEDI